MTDIVRMNEEGRLTLPAKARRELGVQAPGVFRLEVRGGQATLRPADVVVRTSDRVGESES